MLQYFINFAREIIADNFAGGGGASIGIEQALKRPVDYAINHSKIAMKIHKLNHHLTKHFIENVFQVDIRSICKGLLVGLVWLSPDCKHFSKALGKVPLDRAIRALAWVARRWAKLAKPRLFILENVPEFATWGPLIPKLSKNGEPVLKDDKVVMVPDPKRKGLTFWAFNEWFHRNGYITDWRVLKACDYGAPTIRQRLFWVARRDNQPIVWPKPTHGPKDSLLVKAKKLKPYRTADECIDFDIPCPSIFMTKNEAKKFNDTNGTRIKRPLVENTHMKIAKGIDKYILKNKKPFIAPTGSKNECAFISRQFGQSIGHKVDEPMGTITAGGMGKTYLVTAFLEKYDIKQPHLSDSALAGAEQVAAFLIKYYGTGIGQTLNEPLHTIPTRDRFALITVKIKGEHRVITDIGYRLLQPEELKLAQGFPADYDLGDISKSAKVRLIGNSVPPQLAKAMVEANYDTFNMYQQSA